LLVTERRGNTPGVIALAIGIAIGIAGNCKVGEKNQEP
jgi:hypothetical protein